MYDAVGWTAYTREPEQLLASVRGSHRVALARAEGMLVGLAAQRAFYTALGFIETRDHDPELRAFVQLTV